MKIFQENHIVYRKLGNLLPRAKLARSVSILVGGTAGAQLLTIIASPLLTRLYSPEDFGLLAVYLSLLSIFSVVATARYELAIPLPSSQRDAAKIVVLCLAVLSAVVICAAVSVLLFGSRMAQLFGEPRLDDLLWLLPISVLLGGCYTVFGFWATRESDFSRVAKARVGQALAGTLIQVAGFKLGGGALVASQAASQGVGTYALGKRFFSAWNSWNLSRHDVVKAATRYRRFPLYSIWEGLFNTAGAQLPALIFAAFFGPATAGLYSLANRVLSLPMSLIGSAAGQVFFASAAQAHREGALGALIARFHAKLANIGMPPALLLMLCGPDLFALIFGENWRPAGDFARWMSPWLYFVFVASPISTIFAVIERQVHAAIFQLLLLIARIGAICLGVALNDLSIAVILFSGVSAFCWAGFLVWVRRTAMGSEENIWRSALHAFLFSSLCALPLIASMLIIPNEHAWIPGLIGSLGCYGGRLLFVLKKSF